MRFASLPAWSRFSRLCVAGCLLASGCSAPPAFDASSEAAFVASCVRSAVTLTQRMGLREGSVAGVAGNIAVFATGVEPFRIARDFDPSVTLPIVGSGAMDRGTAADKCGSAWPMAGEYAGVDGLTAFTVGNQRLLEAASVEQSQLRALRRQIASAVAVDHERLQTIRRRLVTYSPKVTRVRVVDAPGNKHVPAIAVEVFNPTDRAIDGLLMTVFVKSSDGVAVAGSRMTYQLPVPLASGVQSSYEIPLTGTPGLDTPAVVSAFANFGTATISLSDVTFGGSSLLENLSADPSDARRLGNIDVLIARIEDHKSHLLVLRRRGNDVR